ncbi:MAG: TraB/GumN family protein [Smithellaceae bacterium]|nr:TraB/GumN family protein [Smithellaceae bacterium]
MEQENVRRIRIGEKEIVLVGTAHISKESAEQVERVIEEERPDTVCVELCQARYDAIRQPENWHKMDIVKLIKEKKASLLLAQWVVASYQRKIAEKFQIRPGEEMLRAVRKAEEIGAELVLADRDIRVTLLRTWRMMGLWGKVKLLTEIMAATLFSEEITEEDIEKLKKQDVLDLAIASLREKLPTVKTTLIDERDQWLAHKIRESRGNKIVAVVGAGHLSGVVDNMGLNLDPESINHIPPPGPWSRAATWAFPALIVGLILGGFLYSGNQAGLNMILWWSAITASFSALGALLMLAHPATILTAALAAPITTLHPLLAAGWVAGITEATMRKPQVKDFMALREDIISLRGFFRNKITRILIMVALVNITTSVGTFVAIPVMMRYF